MVDFSKHALVRAEQRNLSEEAIRYVMAHGEKSHKAGARIYFLRKKDIPPWDRADKRWSRLAGTAVVLTKDGRRVITVWRNRHKGRSRIRRKPDYELTPEQMSR